MERYEETQSFGLFASMIMPFYSGSGGRMFISNENGCPLHARFFLFIIIVLYNDFVA